MPNLQIPTIPYFESKLRICKDMLYIYGMEQLRLEKQLEKGAIEQNIYDDAIAAIQNDMGHLWSEIEALTVLNIPEEKEAA